MTASPAAALLVALGAAVGAPTRWAVDRAVARRLADRPRTARTATLVGALPWGTLTVNLVGSLGLGLVLGVGPRLGPGGQLGLLAGTGFCGAFTTYSAFAVESVLLTRGGRTGTAVVNVVLSVVAGTGLAALGWWVGGLVTR